MVEKVVAALSPLDAGTPKVWLPKGISTNFIVEGSGGN